MTASEDPDRALEVMHRGLAIRYMHDSGNILTVRSLSRSAR
jgi:hypothetical protein